MLYIGVYWVLGWDLEEIEFGLFCFNFYLGWLVFKVEESFFVCFFCVVWVVKESKKSGFRIVNGFVGFSRGYMRI